MTDYLNLDSPPEICIPSAQPAAWRLGIYDEGDDVYFLRDGSWRTRAEAEQQARHGEVLLAMVPVTG